MFALATSDCDRLSLKDLPVQIRKFNIASPPVEHPGLRTTIWNFIGWLPLRTSIPTKIYHGVLKIGRFKQLGRHHLP